MRTAIYSTQAAAPADRMDHWTAVIAEAYFPLDLTFRRSGRFVGELRRTQLGPVGLSRLRSDALHYERVPQHISHSHDEEYLITIPRRGPVEFSQFGREVRCDPGGFIIERGDEPYRFLYADRNDLFVLKANKQTLADRLRQPDRFCAKPFSVTSGVGKLFATMAQQAAAEADSAADNAVEVLGRHLIELLALALEETGDASSSRLSTAVREAHIRRVESYVRHNLTDPRLSPERIAAACGISKRYLHELYRGRDVTVSRFIRDERLDAARTQLAVAPQQPISDIAYRFGFADQAQFSRLFRGRFGLPPSAYRHSIGRPH